MAKYLPLPDGSSLEVPDDMSLNEAMSRAKEAFPDLYAPKQQGKGPEGGFLASLKAGTSGLKSDVAALAGKAGLMDEDAAQKYIDEQKKYQQKTFKPTEEGWSEAPFTKVKELLGGSLPYMAAPVVAGAVAPAGAAALGATGLASLAQFTGSNLSRQMDEGKTLKETELGSAAAAAIPQAALDVVSLKMLPGVRGIFGQAGKNVPAAAAKEFAEKGVAKIAGDYALATGKAMTAEGLTEAGQQFFERMQAGLELTDAKARDEYWESLVGGAVLGGTIAPVGRYVERGAEKSKLDVERRKEADALSTQQREDARLAKEEAAAAEAQAEAERKADPAYASQFLTDYETRFAEFKGISLKKPGKDATFEEKEIYQENKAKKAELGKALADDTPEYRRIKASMPAVVTPTAVAPIPVQAQTDMFGGAAPIVPAAPEPVAPVDYREEVRVLTDKLDAIRTQAKEAKDPAQVVELGQQYTQIKTTLDAASKRMGKPLEQQIELAQRKMQLALDEGDVDLAAKQAAKLVELQSQYTPKDKSQTEMPMFDRKNVSETTKDFSNRTYPRDQRVANLQAVQSEEEQALQETLRQDEATAKEVLREQKVTPEKLALQRMAERPAGAESMSIPLETEGPQQDMFSSQVMAATRQDLLTAPEANAYREISTRVQALEELRAAGNKDAAMLERLDQAKKDLAAAERNMRRAAFSQDIPADELTARVMEAPQQGSVTKAPGDGQFRLQSLQGEATKPTDAQSIEQRLASALARKDLPQEAYVFLRRAENVMPGTDALRALVDKELTQIEARRPGADYLTKTKDLQALPIGGTQVTKRVAERTRPVLRGPSAKMPGLLDKRALNEALLPLEQAKGEGPLPAKQRGLFDEETDKLGAAKSNRAAFIQFERSKFVQGLKAAIAKDRALVQKAKELPKLQARVEELTAGVAAMEKINLQYAQAARIIQQERDLGKVRRNMNDILAALNKVSVEGMQLDGRIEELQQLRGQLVQEGRALGETVEMPFLAELNHIEEQLNRAQTDNLELRGALDTLKGQLRVQSAKAMLAKLNPQTVTPDALERAKEELRAAQVEAGIAAEVIRTQEKKRTQEEAAQRRAAEATNVAIANKEQGKRRKEAQQLLEAMYGEDADKTRYETIDAAKRYAMENPRPVLTEAEKTEEQKNPSKVLGGYKSDITKLEKAIYQAQMQSDAARRRDLNAIENALYALSKKYKDEASATKRAAILPDLEAAESAFNEAVRKFKNEPRRPWPGMKQQVRELGALYVKHNDLEERIQSGEIEIPEKGKSREIQVPSKRSQNKALKEVQANMRAEAARRADAPTTSGEALTPSQVKKASKQQKTVFGSSGATPVVEGDRDSLAERTEDIIRIRDKQKAGKPLNPFDTDTLRRMAKAVAAGLPETDFDLAVEETDAQQDPLTAEGKEALADGRLLDILENIAETSPHQFIRDNAKALIPLVARTRISVSPDLKVNGQDVPAAYSSTENMIGVRPGYETESAIIHEATHAATMRALEGPEVKLNADQLAAKKELTAIYNALKKKGVLEGKYASKDVKEFASEVQSNANLRQHLDKQKMFGSTALRRVWDTLLRLIGLKPSTYRTADAQAVIERLYMQSGKLEKVADAAVGFSAQRPKYESENALTKLAGQVIAEPKSFKERFANNAALKAEMETVDMRAGLREALKTGDTKNYQQAMYNVTKADQKMALTYSTLQNGAPELYTDEKGFRGIKSERRGDKPTAVNIFEAVARVPGKNEQAKMALATTYMIAQRAANKGLTKLDLGALRVTEEQLAEAMAFVNSNKEYKDALENVRAKYNAYNAGLIKFLADTGAIPKKMAEEFLKDGDYVPYYRVRQDGVAELVFGGEKTVTIGDIRHQPYLAELKGGDTKILPLSESLPRNTMLLMDKALTNMATKNVAYALQDIGKGKGPIDDKTGKPKDLMPIHSGMSPGGPNILVFNQEPDPKNPKDDGQRWIRVETDGTIMGGIPAELVVKSLEGAHLTLPSFLKLGGMAGDLLRSGVTRTPLYIMRQLIRDPMAATFTSGLNYGPLSAIYKATKEFVKMQSGNSATAAKLIEKGLIQSQIFNGDPDDLSKFALQLASGKDQNALDSLLAMADRAAMSADAATRALVYENAIKNGLSEVEADMMVMESMNFNKRGLSPTIQYASRLIPFFNAQIQGLNVLYKAARGQMPFEEQQRIKQKFFNNGMALMATGLIYAMAMQDDEYYKNAKPKDRYSNFFMYIPGVKEPLKIPIPYEAGWFFSAAVATVDAMVGEVDTKQQLTALKDMFLGSIPGYSSAGVPQIAKPVFEVWTNKNFFSGNNIESVGMQNKRTEDRYVAATTEMAKAMSRMAPILSPVQIEHIVRGYLGVMPIAAMATANDLFAKESAVAKPEGRLTDMPLIGSAFQKQYGGADIDVVYKLAQDAMETNTSFNSLKKTGTPEDIRAFREEHKAELRAAPLAGTFKQNMARLKLQEDLITNRMPLTPEEKRARIDKIDKARQEMAETFMKRIKAIENQS